MSYEVFSSEGNIGSQRKAALILASSQLSIAQWERMDNDGLIITRTRAVEWSTDGGHNQYVLRQSSRSLKLPVVAALASTEVTLNKYRYGDAYEMHTTYAYAPLRGVLTVSQYVEPHYKSWASEHPDYPQIPTDYLIDQKSKADQWQQFIAELQTPLQ